jgi:hypothetical protein
MPNLDPFTLVLASFVILALGIMAYFVYNLRQPLVTRRARVTGKRKSMSLGGGTGGYVCTFEFEDGRREEFDISVDTYVSLNAGDVGDLDTKGALFWGFRPEGEGIGVRSGLPKNLSIPDEPLRRIKEALFRGQKVKAIGLYRECTGATLAEAKATVEQLEAHLHSAEPDKFAGAP